MKEGIQIPDLVLSSTWSLKSGGFWLRQCPDPEISRWQHSPSAAICLHRMPKSSNFQLPAQHCPGLVIRRRQDSLSSRLPALAPSKSGVCQHRCRPDPAISCCLGTRRVWPSRKGDPVPGTSLVWSKASARKDHPSAVPWARRGCATRADPKFLLSGSFRTGNMEKPEPTLSFLESAVRIVGVKHSGTGVTCPRRAIQSPFLPRGLRVWHLPFPRALKLPKMLFSLS